MSEMAQKQGTDTKRFFHAAQRERMVDDASKMKCREEARETRQTREARERKA